MAKVKPVKKWELLKPDEGSLVTDRRRNIELESRPVVENQTLAKISRYKFKKRVIFKGFFEFPIDIPDTRNIRESQNCISSETVNVVVVGKRNMFWFLRKKEL